jgi:hypothetical protein
MVLGQLTADDGLVLRQSVDRFAVHLDTRRATVWCPVCGARRAFHGVAVIRNAPKA